MKKVLCILGIIFGVAMIATGVWMILESDVSYSWEWTSSYAFGADFYTEEYTATANAANNLHDLGYMLKHMIEHVYVWSGMIIASLGGAISCYFGLKMDESKKITAVVAPEIDKEM